MVKTPRTDQTVPYLQAARERAARGREDEDTLSAADALADVAAVCASESTLERFVMRTLLGMSPEAAARACRRELEEDGNG